MSATEQTSPLGERVSRIEGGYEHLATKADLTRMKAELKADVARLDAGISALSRSTASPHRNNGDFRSEFDSLRSEIRALRWWILSSGAACVVLPRLVALLIGG